MRPRPPILFFSFWCLGRYSTPALLLFPSGSGYSYFVSICFAGPYQFILVCAYEMCFATQWRFVKRYKPFQCNLIASCPSFPISCGVSQVHSVGFCTGFLLLLSLWEDKWYPVLHKARQVLADDIFHKICWCKFNLQMFLKKTLTRQIEFTSDQHFAW